MATFKSSYRASSWKSKKVGGRRGSIGGARAFLKELPVSLAHGVARRASPMLTSFTVGSFAAGESVYGDARPRGVGGHALTLEKTGATKRTLRFATSGTIVRCVLGTKYARFLIGKYAVLPNGNAAIPMKWRRGLGDLVAQELVRA